MFYPWLKKILLNRCYQLFRNDKNVSFNDVHLQRQELLFNSIDDQFEQASNSQSLFEALRWLSDELRSCVMLRYFSSAGSYEQIATVLNIPVGTVRSRLAAAREQLTKKFFDASDANDSALLESSQWSDYYLMKWQQIYDDPDVRNEFFDHHDPAMYVRFTSGKHDRGRKLLEMEISNDLQYGTRFLVNEVTTSGNISVIEGPNLNSDISPDRCAPSTVMILFRVGETVNAVNVFDSART
jgi:RNA polymerase sigma-70 factor (ECF subfamily)